MASEATERAMGSFWLYFEEKWMMYLSDGDDVIVKDFMFEVYDGEYIVVVSVMLLDGLLVVVGGVMREDEDGASARAAARARG